MTSERLKLSCINCGRRYPDDYKGIMTCCSPQKADEGFTPVNEIRVLTKTEQRYTRKPISPNNCNKIHFDRQQICKSCEHYVVDRGSEFCSHQKEIGKLGYLWHHKGIPNMETHCPKHKWDVITPRKPVTNAVALTALSVKKHSYDRQLMCLNTWKQQGLPIYAINTAKEIEELKNQYKIVDVWIEQNETSVNYNYPTQLIRNMAKVAIKIDKPVILINSDIEIYDINPFLKISDEVQNVGIRWNYVRDYNQSMEFQFGLDLFTFTPYQASLLPEEFPYAIGQAMWDYAVPHLMKLNDIKLNIVHKEVLFHKEHKQNWDQQGWKFGWTWLKKQYPTSVFIGWRSDLFREYLEDNKYQYDLRLGRYVKRQISGSNQSKDGQQLVSGLPIGPSPT